MRRFADVAEAGRAVADLVVGRLGSEPAPLVVALLPEGAVVARAVADVLGAQLVAAWVLRTDEGPEVDVPALASLAGRDTLLVTTVVETGQAVAAAARVVRTGGAARVRLAAAVCPRDAQAALGRLFDDVWAVERPLGRRAAAWHFESYEVPGPDEAAAIARPEC